MKRAILGIVIAALVLYFWGFLYWGFGPYPRMIWKKSKDDIAAGKALLEHFPEDGTYYVPSLDDEQNVVEERFEAGPVAFVHMLDRDGRPMADMSIMIQGFFLNLVVILLVAVLLREVGSALPTYFSRVKFVALVGLTAAILIDVGGAVWWKLDWTWKLYQAFYDFSVWVIVGLVLAVFIKPKSTSNS